MVDLPENLTRLYLYEYPPGHPNGPWECTVFIRDHPTWFRGRGPTPEAAMANIKDLGRPAQEPVTYTIDRAETEKSAKRIAALGITLDL